MAFFASGAKFVFDDFIWTALINDNDLFWQAGLGKNSIKDGRQFYGPIFCGYNKGESHLHLMNKYNGFLKSIKLLWVYSRIYIPENLPKFRLYL